MAETSNRHNRTPSIRGRTKVVKYSQIMFAPKKFAIAIAALVVAATGSVASARPASAAASEPTLKSGEMLSGGESLLASDGVCKLSIQTDGNLVLTESGKVRWHTATHGNSGSKAVMQTDGNFVIYNAANTPIWQTQTHSKPGAYIAIQDDCNIVVYQGGAARWQAGTTLIPAPPPLTNMLKSGQTLASGQKISSSNGNCHLRMQTDGNLALQTWTWAAWHTQTYGNPSSRLAMQTDGNLVAYNSLNRPTWQTATSGKPGSYLFIQDDCNVVLYQNGSPKWQSGTAVFANCGAARAAGRAPINRGEPGFAPSLDGNSNGVGCE